METGGPPEIATLEQALERLAAVEAEAARVKAINSDLEARNALLELQNAKMRRHRLVDQLEIAFEEAEIAASEDERLGELAVAKTSSVRAFFRASALHRAPCPSTCRASASLSRRPRAALVVAAPSSRSLART